MQDNLAIERLNTPFPAGNTGACGKAATGNVQYLASVEQILQFTAQIEDLAVRALSPNILFEPAFLCAAWKHFFAGDPRARVVLVWDGVPGQDRKLIGLLPLSCDTKLWGGVPLGVCFRNNMKFIGAPLVDRDKAALALDHLLASVREVLPYPAAVMVDDLPAEGEFAGILLAALARRLGCSFVRQEFTRDDGCDAPRRGICSRGRKQQETQGIPPPHQPPQGHG